MNELRPATVDQVSKAQWIRLLDVFAIGPLMVWGGTTLLPRHRLAGAALALFGVAAVYHNGRNYLQNARR